MATEPTERETLFDEIDSYGHRQFIKRLAKERKRVAALERELRALIRELDTEFGKELYSDPTAAKSFKDVLKYMLRTGAVPGKLGEPAKKKTPQQVAEERAAQIADALAASRAGKGAQIPNERPFRGSKSQAIAEAPMPKESETVAAAESVAAADAQPMARSPTGRKTPQQLQEEHRQRLQRAVEERRAIKEAQNSNIRRFPGRPSTPPEDTGTSK